MSGARVDLTGRREIIVRVDLETGETVIEAVGFGGLGCREATAPFEDALGVAHDRTMKPVAWNTTATETVPQHLRAGGAT